MSYDIIRPMEDIKNKARIKELEENGLSLLQDEDGLSLYWNHNSMALRSDFTEMLPRIKPGRLESELIVKASGINKLGGNTNGSSDSKACIGSEKANHEIRPLAIDATAGLGEDSLLLAAAGYNVMLYEHDEIIFALLKDGIERALSLQDSEYDILKSTLSRMETHNENSVDAMKVLKDNGVRPDIVFLDPMFPERRKKSLVGKKLQMLQMLELPCDNEDELLNAAIDLHPRRIIIKRPPKGPYLAGIKPTFSLSGKSVRIDCITF